MVRIHNYLTFVILCLMPIAATVTSCDDTPEQEEHFEQIIPIEITPDTINVEGHFSSTRLTIDIKEAKGQIAAVYIIQEQDSVLFENSFISEGVYQDTLDIECATFVKKDHIIEVELQANENLLRVFRIEIVAEGYTFNPVFIKQEALEPPGRLDVIKLESAERTIEANPVLLKFDAQVHGAIKSIRKIQDGDTLLYQNSFVVEGVYFNTLEMDYATFVADGRFVFVDLSENEGNERRIEIELDALWTIFTPPYLTIIQKGLAKP